MHKATQKPKENSPTQTSTQNSTQENSKKQTQQLTKPAPASPLSPSVDRRTKVKAAWPRGLRRCELQKGWDRRVAWTGRRKEVGFGLDGLIWSDVVFCLFFWLVWFCFFEFVWFCLFCCCFFLVGLAAFVWLISLMWCCCFLFGWGVRELG